MYQLHSQHLKQSRHNVGLPIWRVLHGSRTPKNKSTPTQPKSKRLIKNSITSEKTQNLKTPSSSLPHKTSLKHDSKVSDTSYKQNKKNCVNKKMLSVSVFKCLNLVKK